MADPKSGSAVSPAAPRPPESGCLPPPLRTAVVADGLALASYINQANEGSTVNQQFSGEAFSALTAPTFQGRGTAAKLKSANPDATAGSHKREFDRHDGTGRGHETEKKHGAGKGNWGQEVDAQDEDLELEVQASLAREAELADAGPTFVAAADVPGEEGALTLDEYEAKKKQA